VGPSQPDPALTRSVEDYLKAIYRLTDQGEAASTRAIAGALGLSAPSVSAMVRRLADQGLLDHAPYRGVQLTDEGRRAALQVVRRHRLIESYLVERLGYTWDTVHAEAERLEHAASDELVQRMEAALGHPVVDPHGEPIPGVDGSIAVERTDLVPLVEMAAGSTVVIQQVTTSEPERLRYLAAFGLVPGSAVTVVERQPFNGPIALRTPHGRHTIGYELAESLLCSLDVGSRLD
jgi:DtxR family Mn-dependent transcriptional regulator